MTIPKYHQTKEDLKNLITGGKFSPNDRFFSVLELMEKFNVSRTTACRVLKELSDEGFVSLKHGNGTFVTGHTSKTGPKENNLAFVTFENNFTASFHMDTLNGVRKQFSKRDCSIIYEWITVNKNKKTANKREMKALSSKLMLMDRNNKITGAIFTGTIFRNMIPAFKKIGIPFVIAGDLSEQEIAEDLDIVGNDSFYYGYQAVKHLVDLNHKNIGCIACVKNYSWLKERMRGYRSALKDSGIPVNENLIAKTESEDQKSGYSAMLKLLKLKQRPTAIFIFNDTLTLGAIKAVIERGIKIPEDISLISVGSSDVADFFSPQITTFRYLPQKMGEEAVKILLDKINKKHRKKRITIPAKFIKGNSCRKIQHK
jgi:DNA-binding LacI/PurR family transcriptional regulator